MNNNKRKIRTKSKSSYVTSERDGSNGDGEWRPTFITAGPRKSTMLSDGDWEDQVCVEPSTETQEQEVFHGKDMITAFNSSLVITSS